jgi:hypothetical protein
VVGKNAASSAKLAQSFSQSRFNNAGRPVAEGRPALTHNANSGTPGKMNSTRKRCKAK